MVPKDTWWSVRSVPPPQGVELETAIVDYSGVRMEQSLKLVGRLWFFPDGSMYVYYEPTHWRHMEGGR